MAGQTQLHGNLEWNTKQKRRQEVPLKLISENVYCRKNEL